VIFSARKEEKDRGRGEQPLYEIAKEGEGEKE